MDENKFPNTISMERTAQAPSDNTNDSISEEQSENEGEEPIFKKERQAPGEVAEIERCDTDNKTMYPTPAESGQTNGHQLHVRKDLDLYVENVDRQTPEQIGAKRGYLGKPARIKRNVKEDETEAREYAVKEVVGHSKKNGRSHCFVEWWGYVSNDKTVGAPDQLPDHFMSRSLISAKNEQTQTCKKANINRSTYSACTTWSRQTRIWGSSTEKERMIGLPHPDQKEGEWDNGTRNPIPPLWAV